MAGSLWRQTLETTDATQLTDGPGYDYEPDWSPDGTAVVYVSYQKDAMELWLLDLGSGKSRQLTNGGAVNVEPRWSPDGKKLVWVSTQYHKRFHIFCADVNNGSLQNIVRLTGETKSSLPRYYYSEYDMEINPVWTRDGKEILFVSNKGHIYGTGGFWRMRAEPGTPAQEIHYEETTWKARPDFSPDGRRIVYASYLGQQWHQLWLMPSAGGDAFPISYGDFDNVAPRWSPDGKRIAFISNRGGNTSLWTQEVLGGAQSQVIIKDKHYLKPTGQLSITILAPNGRPTAARILVSGEDGRGYAPEDAWMHADDSFVRSERSFEAQYFHTAGSSELTVPAGSLEVEAMKGFEYSAEKKRVLITAGRRSNLTIYLKPLNLTKDLHSQWVSGDVHVHMN